MTTNDKSFLDKMFDMADAALDPVEKVLRKEPNPDVIDAEFTDHKDSRQEDWEKTFQVTQWAVSGEAWHAFPESTMTANCGHIAKETANRQVLEHGKVIPACTSCIISVSK